MGSHQSDTVASVMRNSHAAHSVDHSCLATCNCKESTAGLLVAGTLTCALGLGVAALQVPVLPRDLGTFHCSLPRLMPLSTIDPSLAIGFFCANIGKERGGMMKPPAKYQSMCRCVDVGANSLTCCDPSLQAASHDVHHACA